MSTLTFTADKAIVRADGLAFIVGKELAVFYPTEVRVTITERLRPLSASYAPRQEVATKEITVSFHALNGHGEVHVGEIAVEPEGINYALFVDNVTEYDN